MAVTRAETDRLTRLPIRGVKMAFRGWPAEALDFFDGLEADNSRTYWQRNKDTYDTSVRAPMEELVAELEPKWGDGKIFRPHRDIRFSPDKSPYKTYIAARVGDGYVHLTAEEFGVGCGMWEMAPDQLGRYRAAVVDERSGKKLVAMVTKVRTAGIDVTGHGVLKTAPRGFPRDHPRIEFLRYKGLVAWQSWPTGRWLESRRAKERIEKFFTASKPLNNWLRTNVGPTTTER
jgi:uncharacterized protein (TIGR02453 family)